jgi:hypothetical protein
MDVVQHDEEWRQLHQRLRGIAKRRAALDAEEARCLREAYDRRLWQRFGYVHMVEYLERELGYGPQVGIERLRIARALAELPQIEASLAEGSLPYSAVRELTRVATAGTEQAWLDQVRGRNLREIEGLVSGKKRGDRPEDPANPDLAKRVVRLELAPAVFALFRQAQSAMADEHGGRLDDSALVEVLCRRALEGDGNSERPSHQIAITVCESCGRGWQNGAGREIAVGPEVVDRARCDAELIGSLDDEQPARLTSTVTPRIRRQVFARDQHRCTVPGCRSARNLDLHHIEFQRDGGNHEPGNLTVLCSGHHQALHDGMLTIGGWAPHALAFAWREPPGNAVIASVEPLQQTDGWTMPGEGPRVIDAASCESSRSASTVASIKRPQPLDDARAMHEEGPRVIDATSWESSNSSTVAIDERPQPLDDARAMHRESPPVIDAASWERSRSACTAAITERPRRPHGLAMRGDGPPIFEAAMPEARVYTALIDHDARTALMTAGYKPREARAAVESARPHVGADATLEQVIREALKLCAANAGSSRVR